MSDFVIRPRDVFEIIHQRRKILFTTFAATFIGIMTLFVVLPRTYQSETTIHIAVSYFQNPLIGELISQTHDPGELRSERERVIMASLGIEFAQKMGEKYKLFSTQATDPGRPAEVEGFLKRLDISPVTATQFKIKFKAKSPEVADGVIRGAMEAIREYMYVNRVQMLEQFFGVLESEITQSPTGDSGRSRPQSEAVKAQMSNRLQDLERKLGDLRRTYNDQHPSVQGLQAEIAEVKSAVNGGSLAPSLTRRKLFQSGTSALGQLTIKDDLSKQKHLVNISLEMEKRDPSMSSYISIVKEPVFPKSPFFPKLKLFLLFALVAGVMFSTIAAAAVEFWLRSEVAPTDFFKDTQIEHLGTLHLPAPEADFQ